MKLRKIVTNLLMLVVTVSCCTVSTYAAELPDQRAFSFMRATGHFDMEVPGNSTVKADKEFPLEIFYVPASYRNRDNDYALEMFRLLYGSMKSVRVSAWKPA